MEIFSWLLFAGLLAIGFVGRELDREDVGNYLIVCGLGLFFAYCFHIPRPVDLWQGWTLLLDLILVFRIQGGWEPNVEPWRYPSYTKVLMPRRWAPRWKPSAKRSLHP